LKRSHLLIIALLVAAGIILIGQPTTLSENLRRFFVRLATPFVRLGELIPVVQARRQLARENEALRAENDRLRQQVHAQRETGHENARLRALLEFKEHTQYRTLGARVIGRDASNWWKSIQIDRGRNDGLREDLPVLHAHGLIGKTLTVTEGESRVLLLLDPNCKISALIQDTREPGVLTGRRMTFVDRHAKIQPGQIVITSGLGGIFPKGILIGTVRRAELNPQSGLFQDVEVQPTVDFNKLEEVLVMLP